MKKLSRALGAVVILILLVLLWPKNPIDKNVTLKRITYHDVSGEVAFVRIPFTKDSDKYDWANVAIDLDQSGSVEEHEWLVRNRLVRVLKEEGSRYTVRIPTSVDQKKDLKATVVLSGEHMTEWDAKGKGLKGSKKRTLSIAEVGTMEMGQMFAPDPEGIRETGVIPRVYADHGEESGETENALDVQNEDEIIEVETEYYADLTIPQKHLWDYGVGYTIELDVEETYDDTEIEPPTLMLDNGDEVVFQQTDTTPEVPATPPAPTPTEPEPANFTVRGMPDHNQDYNECAPTAVSNSFRWLAQEYGFEDQLPVNPEDLINELKGYMEWDNGVMPGDSLSGKQSFIQERGLPLEAHQIGGENDADIFDKIHEELQKGQAVEVSLQFYELKDGVWGRDGAHLVTVTGLNDYTRSGGNKWISFHDPATAEEEGESTSESYRIEGSSIPNFWSGGRTEIRYALAQSPLRNDDGTLISLGETSNLVMGDNGLALSDQSVTRGMSSFGFFNVDFAGVGDHFVGESFPVSLKVTETGKEHTMSWGEESYKVKMVGPWSLEGLFTASLNIDESPLENRPPQTAVNGKTFSVNETFTCTEEGPAFIEYTVALRWASTGEGAVPENISERYHEQLVPVDSLTVMSPVFQCVTNPETVVEEESFISHAPPSCSEVSEDPEGREIEMLKLGGKCYPKFQFRGGGNAHDACGFEHYHGAQSDIVVSLEGNRFTDPEKQACGFGKVGEVEELTIKLGEDQMAPFVGEGVFGG